MPWVWMASLYGSENFFPFLPSKMPFPAFINSKSICEVKKKKIIKEGGCGRGDMGVATSSPGSTPVDFLTTSSVTDFDY